MEIFNDVSPILIPIAGILMPVLIVGVVFWYKGREKELEAHKEMRIREMEHAQKMKQMELEIEKTKATGRDAVGPKVSG